MTMSPQEIQSKQFHVRFRGFDVEEVDAFLEQVAEQYMLLVEEKKNLAATVESVQAELDALKNEEHSFKNAIISAQRVSDDMLQQSQKQADAILLKAQEDADELKDSALREITELEYQVDELGGLKAKLHGELRQVISTCEEQVEQIFNVVPPETEPAEPEHIIANGLEDIEVVDERGDEGEAAVGGENEGDDLYEKIDLGPDGLPLPAVDAITDEFDSVNLEDVGEAGAAIPDLDDDVMFTLEDPLDVEDVEVNISMFEDKDSAKKSE